MVSFARNGNTTLTILDDNGDEPLNTEGAYNVSRTDLVSPNAGTPAFRKAPVKWIINYFHTVLNTSVKSHSLKQGKDFPLITR